MANPDVKKSDKGLRSLAGQVIYIVGPRRFQNELVSLFLEQQTGATCLIREDLGSVQGVDDSHKGQPNPSLVLLDCQGRDPESLSDELESHGQDTLSRISIALFNVDPSLGIEEEVVVRGVRGIFYEQDPVDRLPKGVSAILDGELWVSREIMSKYILKYKGQSGLPKGDTTGLTPREMEILAMVAAGAKNEEIADKLCISPHTVKTHVYNIFKKIDVPNRLQAALWAAKNL